MVELETRSKDSIWELKIGYGKVMILSTRRLIQKMENLGEDWIWHVRIYSTCWINCKNSMKNGK